MAKILVTIQRPLNYLLIAAALVALAIHPDEPGDAILFSSFLQLMRYLDFGKRGKPNKLWNP